MVPSRVSVTHIPPQMATLSFEVHRRFRNTSEEAWDQVRAKILSEYSKAMEVSRYSEADRA